MSIPIKAAILALVCATALLVAAVFFGSPGLNTFAFSPGDYAYPVAKSAGLVATALGRNSEGTHHLFVLFSSLAFWWLVCVCFLSAVLYAYRRMHA